MCEIIEVAATKTFTSQRAVPTYIVVSVVHAMGRLTDSEFQILCARIREAAQVRRRGSQAEVRRLKNLVDSIYTNQSTYYLGRGAGLGVAMEGALKLKEVTYILRRIRRARASTDL